MCFCIKYIRFCFHDVCTFQDACMFNYSLRAWSILGLEEFIYFWKTLRQLIFTGTFCREPEIKSSNDRYYCREESGTMKHRPTQWKYTFLFWKNGYQIKPLIWTLCQLYFLTIASAYNTFTWAFYLSGISKKDVLNFLRHREPYYRL